MTRITSLALVAGLTLAASSAGAQTAPAKYQAEIRRTQYGIPHIKAADYGGLGYGAGYAFAQDNFCQLADQFVTLSGERARYFGPKGTATVSFTPIPNADSDLFFRATLDLPRLRASMASGSPEYLASMRGYVAGYNRYLRETGAARLPAACRDAPWVRPITEDDLLRLNEEKMIQASGGAWLRQTLAAAPPGAAPLPGALAALALPDDRLTQGLGSNGWAFGRDVTANRSGVLLGNPHFPWETTNRFYQVHLTIPGQLDVMGATQAGSPGVSIGFNKDIAWTHTVSTDRHFTLFEVPLDPADPTVYLVDGRPLPMERRTVAVEVAGEAPRTHTFYSTIYGPVVAAPSAGLTWSTTRAYVLKDANRGNRRSGEAWLAFARARSVDEIKTALVETQGIPWVNTIAADRAGQVLYADITATPNVSAAKLAACAPPSGAGPVAATARIYILDGGRSACDWDSTPGAQPGLMPGALMPNALRTDYVANSNDSYWLANPTAPLTGFSPLVGPDAVVQNLRTRAGILEIGRRLAGQDGLPGRKVDPASVKDMLYRNRNLAADLILDDLLGLCAARPTAEAAPGKSVDLTAACKVLAKWDRRVNADSVGAVLFLEFWTEADKIRGLYAVAFDPKDPVNTPRGLSTEAATQTKVLQALASAVDLMAARGLALDTPWGEAQFAVRGEHHIPVHGGDANEGVLNAQRSVWADNLGYIPVHGSSYIQVVTFDAKGPVADAVLSYSQSTDPASPHYEDQTLLYAAKRWNRLPFHDADIAKDKALKVETISQ